MNLCLLDVKNIFNDLIKGNVTREQAEKWAELRMEKFELGELNFDPKSSEELLWKAVIYLSGIALKISPDEYLEDESGIKLQFDSNWNL